MSRHPEVMQVVQTSWNKTYKRPGNFVVLKLPNTRQHRSSGSWVAGDGIRLGGGHRENLRMLMSLVRFWF